MMKSLVIMAAVMAMCHAHNPSEEMVPAVRSMAVTNPKYGASVESTIGSLPRSALTKPTIPENTVAPAWEQHEAVGIYSSSGISNVETVSQAAVLASTYLSAPMVEDMRATDGKLLWSLTATNNAIQPEVSSAHQGQTIVSAAWLSDGYNMSGTIGVSLGANKKSIWSREINGAGSSMGSISMKKDGSNFAVFANVNNSFVIPGHGQILCFSRDSEEPTHTIDFPTGEFGAQASSVMSDDLRLAVAVGTSIHIADCSSGKLLFSHNRGYVATALDMSPDGKYVATAFESVLVIGETSSGVYEVVLDERLTSGNASAPGLWIGAQVALSGDGKVAVGTYNGYTAKQNRVVVYDLAKKSLVWAYDYKPVDFQVCQDVPSAMKWTDANDYLVVGSWGDANHTNPTVNLFCGVCGKVVLSYNTPGSVETVSTTSGAEGVFVVAGGKHVHANVMGAGGDLYALFLAHTKRDPAMKHCAGMDANAMVVDQDEIDRLNSLPDMTWEAGHNERFAGMTVGEVARLMGTIIQSDAIRAQGDIPTEPRVEEEADLLDTPIPEEFSSAKAFAGCVHPIRDQAACGSCWSFGGSETLTDRYCIAAAAKGKNVSATILSAEEMVSCDKQDFGCGGGYLYYAWQFMETYGLVSDSCFPYTAGNGTAAPCATSCVDGSKWSPVKVKNGTLSYYGSEEQIQRALMAGGPVEVAFNVYSDFMQYKSGVYQRTPNAGLMGGHAVKLVGWGVDKASGLKYWEVYNSWGTSWGLNGTFLIRRGVNECGIEYNSIWGDVDV